MTFRRMILATLFATLSSAALADGAVQKLMTPADKARLDRYDETRKAALKEARGGGEPADIKQLDALLGKPLVAFSDKDLTGKWRCRTLKVGGDFGVLTIYDWFACKVTDDGSGWVLNKVSGSQRTKGRLYDDGEKRAIYLGSYFVEGDPVKAYGSGPKTDQVGYAFRTGRNAWRIEYPAPFRESTLDILELRR